MRAILFLLVLSLPSLARPGETREQLEARFGRPKVDKMTAPVFEAGGFRILVTLQEGCSVKEVYVLTDGKPIDDDTLAHLLVRFHEEGDIPKPTVDKEGMHWVLTPKLKPGQEIAVMIDPLAFSFAATIAPDKRSVTVTKLPHSIVPPKKKTDPSGF